MRITNSIMLSDAVYNMNDALRQMDELQQQLASGKAVNRPSDDPARASDIMRLQSGLAGNAQFRRNTTDGVNWLEMTDGVLGSLTDLMHRARQLAVQGADGTLSDPDRQALAQELQSVTEGVVQVSQTTYAGRYIFSGTATSTQPLTIAGNTATYNGNTGAINREIGPGLLEAINISGDRLFTGPNGMLPALFKVQADLQANDQPAVSSDLAELDKALDTVLATRSEVGSKTNRLQAALGWQDTAETSLTALLSTTQDTDVAKVMIQLTSAENTYRAALAVAGRVLPPSLVDFLH